MLYEAFQSNKAEDISLASHNVYNMLLNARKAKSQEKSQKDRRKTRHDLNATSSSVTRPPAKETRKAAATRRKKN